MRGIFFTQIQTEDKFKGAVQKVFDEIDAFEKSGFEIRHVNFKPISEGFRKSFIGKGIASAIPFTCVFSKYEYSHDYDGYDFYYFRFEAADYWFTRFLKLLKKNNPNSKIVVEFPDYPNTYWMTTVFHLPLKLKDYCARHKYVGCVDRFAVLNDEYKSIYGVDTLYFRNGTNIDRIEKRVPQCVPENEIHVIGVCTMFPFHGFDRFLKGMVEYYKNDPEYKIFFHIVGDGPGKELPIYQKIVNDGNIGQYVVFEGRQSGEALSKIYDGCRLAVCSLGMFRINFNIATSLKTREYLVKGLPLISGCPIDVFEGEKSEYLLEFPNDESIIEMDRVIDFYKNVYMLNENAVIENIREFAKEKCDFAAALGNVIRYIMQSRG